METSSLEMEKRIMRGFQPDYDRRLQALIDRRTVPATLTANVKYSKASENEYYQASPIYEVYRRLSGEGSAVRYAVGAMARVDPRYTEITYEQGGRVQSQLTKALNATDTACDFEYQGSMTNDTHIKSYSDIDLLAITRQFWTLEPPQQPSHPYSGDPIAHLRKIRSKSVQCLREAFPRATVDESGAKSVAISGGSLSRKIDVVPANWYDTNQFAQSGAKRHRAIQILNTKTGKRVKNMPFLHNYLIEMRDRDTQGGLRKVVRLMKSLKYDSSEVDLSSYDITSLGYNMQDYQLLTFPGGEISLLVRLKLYLDDLASDESRREDVLVPDNSRKVFTEGHATLAGLNQLRVELDDLVEAISKNRQRSFERLAEARVAY
jgi:hypothetical protein